MLAADSGDLQGAPTCSGGSYPGGHACSGMPPGQSLKIVVSTITILRLARGPRGSDKPPAGFSAVWRLECTAPTCYSVINTVILEQNPLHLVYYRIWFLKFCFAVPEL